MVLCVLVVSLVSLVLGVIFHPFNINPKDNYIELNISKLNQTNFQKFSGFVQSAFDASLEVEMHVNENGSLRATKTIFLKNVGKSERGVLSIHYLYPAIKIDKVVLRNLKLDNASIIQGKDVVFLAFRLSKGKIGEVEVCYRGNVTRLKGLEGFLPYDDKKDVEIPSQFFLSEKFNGTVLNYTVTLNLPSNWEGIILEGYKEAKWILVNEKTDERRTLTFISNNSRFPFAVIGEFKTVSKNVEMNGKNLKIKIFVPENLSNDSAKILDEIEDILQTFSSWYGLYPYSHVEIIFLNSEMGGIYNELGTIFVSANWSTELLAHEIAHAWFGDYAKTGKVEESLATFSALNYETKLSNGGKHNKIRKELDEWENFSLKYNTSLNRAYLVKQPLMEEYAIVYLKGAVVFRSLQFVLGNETFFRGMREILKECHEKYCYFDRIERVFESAYGQDLNWFFKEWFYSAKVPDYEITNLSYENHILGFEIADKNNLRMPVEIKVVAAREVSTERVWVNGTNKTRIALNIERKPDKIVIDPSEWMVNWNRVYSINGVEIRVD